MSEEFQAEIDELDEIEGDESSANEEPSSRGAKRKAKAHSAHLDFAAMTSAEMIGAAGESLSGYRSKQELAKLLEERGYTVLNAPQAQEG